MLLLLNRVCPVTVYPSILTDDIAQADERQDKGLEQLQQKGSNSIHLYGILPL